jgi:putative ABC transport system permease protein
MDEIVGTFGRSLRCYSAPWACVAVICANSRVVLARGAGRRRELAVRLALGAGRARLVAHLLTESVLLALAGGALGVTAAMAFLDGLLRLYPGTLPRAEAIALDWRALAFAAAVTGLTALLFGLLPALRASSSSPETVLRTQTRGVIGGRSRLMRAFVVAEVALSVMLVRRGSLAASLRTFAPSISVSTRGCVHGRASVARADVSTPAVPPSAPLARNRRAAGVESAGAISGCRSGARRAQRFHHRRPAAAGRCEKLERR